MQRALGQENSIKALFRSRHSGACTDSHKSSSCIELSSSSQIALNGMQAAHWDAVQFLTLLASSSMDIVQASGRDNMHEVASKLRNRLLTCFHTLIAAAAFVVDATAICCLLCNNSVRGVRAVNSSLLSMQRYMLQQYKPLLVGCGRVCLV